MPDKLIINCQTGNATYRELTKEEQAEYNQLQSEAESRRQVVERLQLAFDRDLEDYRKLVGKLRPASTDNLTMFEVKLIGRMVAWLWLRDEMEG